ncbi:hypothetical protein FD13_GL000294 [Levilactobacillus senmaizukei DSM 21775 = NBRC 103853]|uniref:Uncharacterized protein n=1 Tax=Levilactobacillus senmaizukei DSM 21775 = NBRC 103853 TaxID=1423803 RepID=A0A0R2DPK6_9LACO|nr:hypothetical protein [Levilactobacillus senmaizukei]KRN02154.1 hypothetical protein FD13_GL000294 [Levilactobacillus senmaizukei DSM 21775 = NBRC 103853]
MFDDLDPTKIKDAVRQGLSAYFNQEDDSVNQAIMDMIIHQFDNNYENLSAIFKQLSLDTATSDSLNNYAKDWGVNRIDNDDDFLRLMIRLAQIRHRKGVTEDDLITIIGFALQAPYNEFSLITDREELNGEPEAIKLTNIPNTYSKSARKKRLLINTLEHSVTPQTRIVSVDFQAKAIQNLFIATATSRNRQHFAVMDSQVDREHVVGDGSTIVATVTQKQRIHRIVKEG